MKRALVLGGGGAVGVAWETAMVAGLMDAGLEVRDADLIIGTSAGSIVGTSVAHGRDPREMLRAQREAAPPPTAEREFDAEVATKIFQYWGSLDATDDSTSAEIGRLALTAKTMPESDWLPGFAHNEWPGWPGTSLLVTAVDCESGAFRAIDASQGVSIELACAASCSVPGLFPPVTIEGRRYTDGGVRSFTSADLALPAKPDVVLIIAVFGAVDRGTHALARHQYERESAQLEAGGASVRVIGFDEAAIAACGMNLMDASKRAPTADAGEAHGRRIGEELAAWWRDGTASG
jgi:NTE family protein